MNTFYFTPALLNGYIRKFDTLKDIYINQKVYNKIHRNKGISMTELIDIFDIWTAHHLQTVLINSGYYEFKSMKTIEKSNDMEITTNTYNLVKILK